MYIGNIEDVIEKEGFIIINVRTSHRESNNEFYNFDRFVLIESNEGQRISKETLIDEFETDNVNYENYLLKVTKGKKYHIHLCGSNGDQDDYHEIEEKVRKGELK